MSKIEELEKEVERLSNLVYAVEPSEYVPDGLTWKQLCAYKEQEKKGGQPVDTYLKTLRGTTDLLLAHHKQAVMAMAQVMQDKELPYIEGIWKEAMKGFMQMPEHIMKGHR